MASHDPSTAEERNAKFGLQVLEQMNQAGFVGFYEERAEMKRAWEAILSRASQPRGIQADGSWICPTCHDPNCGSAFAVASNTQCTCGADRTGPSAEAHLDSCLEADPPASGPETVGGEAEPPHIQVLEQGLDSETQQQFIERTGIVPAPAPSEGR
jgi:hypothetical protein